METMFIKKKLTAQKQIIVDLPQLKEGDEIELFIRVNPTEKEKTKRKMFDMEKWANKWETDLGDEVKSTDVEEFTGRKF